MSNACPEFSGSFRGVYTSLVISLVESKLPQGMGLPHTHGTRGSTKNDKYIMTEKYMMDFIAVVRIIADSVQFMWFHL